MSATHSVKVDTKGRLVIPLSLRKALGIEPGDILYVESEGDQVLRYAKAISPFDVLAVEAMAERKAGRTRNLRDIAVEYDADLESN